jgi:hypothetical protein
MVLFDRFLLIPIARASIAIFGPEFKAKHFMVPRLAVVNDGPGAQENLANALVISLRANTSNKPQAMRNQSDKLPDRKKSDPVCYIAQLQIFTPNGRSESAGHSA